jgi:hypothetical protein
MGCFIELGCHKKSEAIFIEYYFMHTSKIFKNPSFEYLLFLVLVVELSHIFRFFGAVTAHRPTSRRPKFDRPSNGRQYNKK